MRSVRFAVLGVAMGISTAASADVYQDRVLECPPLPEGTIALTTSSHTLYLNPCLPDGCTVTSGTDSSIADRSSIADTTVTLAAYQHGQAHWDEVVQCVKESFSMFDIQVVTEDPGSANHFEVMVAGTQTQLNPNLTSAGGIAPFIACNANRNNLLAFVFANQTSGKDYLCSAIAHEAGHVWGLSHSLDPLDPMTYMDLGQRKHWQNSEQTCGTSTPENCRCFSDTQNSFRYLTTTFGLSPTLGPAELAMDTPREGMWAKPGFPVRAVFLTPLERLSASMAIDDGTQSVIDDGVLAWNAPMTIGAGRHSVTVTATDFADRTMTQTVNVNVTATCAAGCGDDFHCLGGYCLPGEGVTGGLGATCGGNGDCVTGQCSSDGMVSICTGTCDTGMVCPDDYTCLADANVCWPDGGGCSTGRGARGSLVLVFGVLVFARRRRIRR